MSSDNREEPKSIRTPFSLSLSSQLKRKSTSTGVRSSSGLPVVKPSAFEEDEDVDVDRSISDLDPKTREALEAVVAAVAKEGPQAEQRAKLNHKSNPAYWFLFDAPSNPVTKLYRQKVEKFADLMPKASAVVVSSSPSVNYPTVRFTEMMSSSSGTVGKLMTPVPKSFSPYEAVVYPSVAPTPKETVASRKRKSRWSEDPLPMASQVLPTPKLLQISAMCSVGQVGPFSIKSVSQPQLALPGVANISSLGSVVQFTPLPSTSVIPPRPFAKNSVGAKKSGYDSDEDTEGGTWEHKNRKLEMEKTKAFAEKITTLNADRHHLGDFIPPEEMAKFVEKCKGSADPTKAQLDASDYVENKLREDNKGFQLLRKMGWKDGSGLGTEGQGIVAPVNKGKAPSDMQGLGAATTVSEDSDPFEQYRAKMMLAYKYRPNPLNNPRRPYY